MNGPTDSSSAPVARPGHPHLWKVIGYASAAALGGFLFGFDSSVINGAIGAMATHFQLSAALEGFVVAIALIGSAVGAWYAGQITERIGRKKVMTIAAILFVVAALGQGLSVSVPDLVLWRVVAGLGVGVASIVAPSYISEIAPAWVRGALGSLQQLAITLGIFCTQFVNFLLVDAAGSSSNDLLGLPAWRWMFLVGLVPAVVYGIFSFLIPESPRYLVRRGRDAEATAVLVATAPEDPAPRIRAIHESLVNAPRSSFRDIRGPALGLQAVVWIGVGLAVFQQFAGINVIFYYSNTLWGSVGFGESNAFITSAITSGINVVMTLVAIAFVDRIGRRVLLLIGSAGMFLSLLLAAIAFSNAQGTGTNVTLPGAWGPLALVGANLFVIFFAATWGPVMWVMLGEMFPNRMRAQAMALSTAANWIANFMVAYSFPVLSTHLKLGLTYGIYSLMALLSLFFVLKWVPETKGRTLEEMDHILEERGMLKPSPAQD